MSEEEPEAAPAWVPTFPAVRRLDALWCRAERIACAVMFLAMGLMVFATVVTEVFGRRQKWFDVAVLWGVCVLAAFTRTVKEGERPRNPALALGVATAIAAVIALTVRQYVQAFPGGFIWAQKLAMVLMIWVAMLGASVATQDRSHLALEMGEKLWPARVLPFVKALAHAVTTGFCIIFFVVAVKRVMTMHDEGGPVSQAAEWIPLWAAFLVVPYAFLAMAIRFGAQAVTTATGKEAPAEEKLPS